MWYGERIEEKRKMRKPKISLHCGLGQVQLPLLKESPELLKVLLHGEDDMSIYFWENIRQINICVPQGCGPKMFQFQGENYHLKGSLKPLDGEEAKFSQLYIVDTENEVENRAAIIGKYKKSADKGKKESLRKQVIEKIVEMLNEVNPYVHQFRSAMDRFNTNPKTTFNMQIVSMATLIPGNFNLEMDKRDIVLQEKQTGWLKRISEIHPSYLALQCPLIFTYDEDGFRLGIEKRATDATDKPKRKNISMRHLRSDSFDSIQQSENNGKTDMHDQGSRFLLPDTFVGGLRYMKNMYLDAMAICKYFGFPYLFITFTCNPKRPEITRYVQPRKLSPDDRPNILCKIFKCKLDFLMDDLTNKELLEKTVTYYEAKLKAQDEKIASKTGSLKKKRKEIAELAYKCGSYEEQIGPLNAEKIEAAECAKALSKELEELKALNGGLKTRCHNLEQENAEILLRFETTTRRLRESREHEVRKERLRIESILKNQIVPAYDKMRQFVEEQPSIQSKLALYSQAKGIRESLEKIHSQGLSMEEILQQARADEAK
ncbi:hypothetical protein N665_0146s0005 [Sinapis alba]|nr:hypothetical protein N665_0146s0005 [Sinapis alba]